MTVEERLSPQCTICGAKKELVRDHCHRTGYIRGILCNSCNIHLGTLQSVKKKRSNKWHVWYEEYEDKIEEFRKYHVSIPFKSFASKKILFMLRDAGVQAKAHQAKPDSMSDFLSRINIV